MTIYSIHLIDLNTGEVLSKSPPLTEDEVIENLGELYTANEVKVFNICTGEYEDFEMYLNI